MHRRTPNAKLRNTERKCEDGVLHLGSHASDERALYYLGRTDDTAVCALFNNRWSHHDAKSAVRVLLALMIIVSTKDA